MFSYEQFYREAEIRDEKMAENVLSVLNRGPSSADGSHLLVLVTGGFHSSGIEQRLSKAGCKVVSFVPRITHLRQGFGGQAHDSYLSVFSQEKSPLSKLFEGEKLFLSPLQTEPLPLALFWSASLTNDPNGTMRISAPGSPFRFIRQSISKGIKTFHWKNSRNKKGVDLEISATGDDISGIRDSSTFGLKNVLSDFGGVRGLVDRLKIGFEKVRQELRLNRQLIIGFTVVGVVLFVGFQVLLLVENPSLLSSFLGRASTLGLLLAIVAFELPNPSGPRRAIIHWDTPLFSLIEKLNPEIKRKVEHVLTTPFPHLTEGVDYDYRDGATPHPDWKGRSVVIKLITPVIVNGISVDRIKIKGGTLGEGRSAETFLMSDLVKALGINTSSDGGIPVEPTFDENGVLQ